MDHNATSVLDKDVQKNIKLDYANPSSLHLEGREARNIVENMRFEIIKVFNAVDSGLIFTGTATEANNMIFNSFCDYKHIISSVEHLSVLKSAFNPILIPVTDQGVVELNQLELIISELGTCKFLVSVMVANNETGAIQPIKLISQLTHKYGGVMHTDASQGCGKITIDMEELEVDLMSLSPHKFGCLSGFGILLFKSNLNLKALIFGGGQEKELRGGSENVIAISSFQFVGPKLLELINKMTLVQVLRDELEDKILDVYPAVKIFSKKINRLPNTTCIVMPNILSSEQLMYFDLNGIAVGSGSACSSGVLESASHVLSAMTHSCIDLRNAIRVSLGYDVNSKDIKRFANIWKQLFDKRNVVN